MKNKILFLAMLLFLVGCGQNDDEVDSTSSATGKWDPSILEKATEADLQFGNLRKGSEGKTNDDEVEIITSIRPNITKFIVDEFSDENSAIRELGDIKYRLNKKAMSTIFNNNAQHKFVNVGYDYFINIKQLDKKYTTEEFVKEVQKNNSQAKTLETPIMGTILVENINSNSYSAMARSIYQKEDKSYYIEIGSEVMSIPEVVVLMEKFYEDLD